MADQLDWGVVWAYGDEWRLNRSAPLCPHLRRRLTLRVEDLESATAWLMGRLRELVVGMTGILDPERRRRLLRVGSQGRGSIVAT